MIRNDKLDSFLRDFSYLVVHEEDRLQMHIEHFFTGIEKSSIQSKVVLNYLDAHTKKFPVKNLSKVSMEYLSDNSEYYYILIDSLNKKDPFYKQKAKFVENNTANILSIKWTGEPVDMSAHLVYNAEKYIEDFKDISAHVGTIAKERIKENFVKGRELFNDKKPLIDEKIGKIKKLLKK